VRVDANQRVMWRQMIGRTDDYEAGRIDLGKLVRDLRGLFVEADPHDRTIRDDFECYWSPIDAEHELRTEAWAPAGTADDEALARYLDAFRGWVNAVVLADETEDHD
jgi:hypothetical protein